MAPIYIWNLVWDDGLINKLKREHGLEFWEVEEAVIWDPNKEARWVRGKKHGRRLCVMGVSESHNKLILAFLDPVNRAEGIWRVRTAWEV